MKLVISGTAILAAVDDVQDLGDRYEADGAHYLKSISDVVEVEALPDGFDARYCIWDGNAVVCSFPESAPPGPVPLVITARQFFIQLVIAGIATEEQAVARTIPALINTALNSLPPEQALAARITWAQMTEIPRDDPLFLLVGPVLEMSEADIDDFFRAAGAIS